MRGIQQQSTLELVVRELIVRRLDVYTADVIQFFFFFNFIVEGKEGSKLTLTLQ